MQTTVTAIKGATAMDSATATAMAMVAMDGAMAMVMDGTLAMQRQQQQWVVRWRR